MTNYSFNFHFQHAGHRLAGCEGHVNPPEGEKAEKSRHKNYVDVLTDSQGVLEAQTLLLYL